jgi:DNA helicase-4
VVAVVFLVGLFLLVTIYLVNKNNSIISLEYEISSCYSDFIEYYCGDYYFSKRSFSKWRSKYERLESNVFEINNYVSNLDQAIDRFGVFKELVRKYVSYFLIKKDYSDKVKYLVNIFNDGFDLVKKRNKYFIEEEKKAYRDLFQSVDGKALTEDQMNSVVVDEACNLVVAGVGTGKTLSLIGKIGYILEKGLAKPDEILILSYERVKDELSEKVKANFGDSILVNTFHSFGSSVIGEISGEIPVVADFSNDSVLLQKTLDGFLQRGMNEVEFANLVNKYFGYYLRPVENRLEIFSREEYEDYIRTVEIRSLNGERVKSIEECEIANFLFMNQVRYEYEKEYIYSTSEDHRRYTPDFYLPDYGIWIEHIDVDRNCNTITGVDRWEYLDSWYWRRQTHKKYMTECLETYGYQHMEGTLLSSLSDMLTSRGVIFRKLPNELTYSRLQRLGDVSLFVGLLSKFLLLYKSSTLTIEDLRRKSADSKHYERYNAFLDVYEPIYRDYKSLLNSVDKIDFNDMINKAIDFIVSGAYVSKFKYILVDDFQDISQSRYRLIKALLKSNPDSHLFCVGDDWQSINRFSGGDLSIMTSFDKLFEFNEKMFLRETFRFNDKIAGFSSEFIMKNQYQYKKEVFGSQCADDSVFVVWYDDMNSALDVVLTEISRRNPGSKVYILGRYGEDNYRDLDISRFYRCNSLQNLFDLYDGLDVQYSTIHGAKGSQRDIVVLVGVRSGSFGFPCEFEDDSVLNLVLGEDDVYPNGEERRVFYVGITRAKSKVYILADRTKVSSFVLEICGGDYDVTFYGDEPVKCPLCQEGYLAMVEGDPDFYGCTNYLVNGCSYKQKIIKTVNTDYLELGKNKATLEYDIL